MNARSLVAISPRRALALAATLALACAASSCGHSGASSGSAKASHSQAHAADAAHDNVTTLGPRDVAVATGSALAAGIVVTGSLDPAEEVEVRAQNGGQVTRVLVDRGHVVRRGQVLASYDDVTWRAQAASAEAALASSERDLDAADTLYKAGVLSERDFTQASVARDAARANLTQAREHLGHATVRAPITGQVREKRVSAGEVVQPGAPLFVIVNNDALELAGQVGADEIGRVRLGQRVSLALDAYPGRTILGKVDRIEPVADPTTRRVGVFIRVPNPDHGIVAGLFATGTILTAPDATSDVPVVPAVAVRAEDGGSFVYAVARDRVERRAVTLGVRDERSGLVEIRAGLAKGEQVIVAPGALAPGTSVRVVAAAAMPAPQQER